MSEAVESLPPCWCSVRINDDTYFSLDRVSIRHFRSIGADGVEIDLTKPVTLLIGPNNAGKTNALLALGQLISLKGEWLNRQWQDLDRHQRRDIQPTLALYGTVWHNFGRAQYGHPGWHRSTLDIEQHLAVTAAQPDQCRVRVGEKWALEKLGIRVQRKDANEWLDCSDYGRSFVTKVLTSIPYTSPHTIGPIRCGMPCTGDTKAFHDLVSEMSAWERPSIGKEQDGVRWSALKSLLSQILDEDISLHPKSDGDSPTVIVTSPRDGHEMRLPLDHCGTGFQEVLAMARELAVSSPTFFLMEEPEVHLHPRVQRRLLDALVAYAETAGHRFVVSTHSPFLLSGVNDACGVVRVTRSRTSGVSVANQVVLPSQVLQTLDDLGLSASDILQARYVIWVEGPSDAIYIQKWMALYCSTNGRRLPVRGVDYCFAWYGGALVAHISVGGEVAIGEEDNDGDDPPDCVSRLVELLNLSQYGALVLDSDQASSAAPRKGRTKRLVAECEQSSNRYIAWVTAGREIENYLDAKTVARAINSRAIRASSRIAEEKLRIDQWDRLDESLAKAIGASGGKRPYSGAGGKVAAARTIVEHMDTFLDKHDLGEQIGRLLDAIESRSDVIGTGR